MILNGKALFVYKFRRVAELVAMLSITAIGVFFLLSMGLIFG